jgi:hypothetical protein
MIIYGYISAKYVITHGPGGGGGVGEVYCMNSIGECFQCTANTIFRDTRVFNSRACSSSNGRMSSIIDISYNN